MRWNLSKSRLWQNVDFVKLWAGQSVSLFGAQISLLALPLVAVETLNATAAQMGILTALGFAPELLFGLPVGAWVDRRQRRPIMIGADIGRALLIATIPVAFVFGVLRIEHLYGVGLLVGFLSVLYRTAYASLLPTLVPRNHLVEANSKLELSNSVAGVAGPSVAGAVVRLTTAPVALVGQMLAFLTSAVFLSRIQTRELSPPQCRNRAAFLQEIRDGLRFLWTSRMLRATALGAGTFNLFDNMRYAIYVLFVTRELDVGAGVLGIIFAVAGGSALVGALLTRWVTHQLGIGPTIIGALLLGGIGTLILPFTVGSLTVVIPLLLVQQALFGITGPPLDINIVSLRQALTPDHLLGRIRASASVLTLGTLPLGALLGGFLGEVLGLRTALLLAAAGSMLSCLWVVLSPLRSLHALPSEADEQPMVTDTVELSDL